MTHTLARTLTHALTTCAQDVVVKEWGQSATIETLKQRSIASINKWNAMIR